MSKYNLTESQKELLQIIVKSDDEGQLVEKGILLVILGNDQYTLWGCKLTLNSLSDIKSLCDEGLLSRVSDKSNPKYRIRNSARIAIANDFNKPTDPSEARFSIGAIIGSVNGGNIQAIGNAQNSEILQTINDPRLIQPFLEQLAENLLNEVKAELSVREYAKYQEAVASSKKQLSEEKPSKSAVKKLIQTISFLGDIEGSVGLMLRVWSLVQPFVITHRAKISTRRPNTACTRLVAVRRQKEFTLGSKLVSSKRLHPSHPPAGNANRWALNIIKNKSRSNHESQKRIIFI